MPNYSQMIWTWFFGLILICLYYTVLNKSFILINLRLWFSFFLNLFHIEKERVDKAKLCFHWKKNFDNRKVMIFFPMAWVGEVLYFPFCCLFSRWLLRCLCIICSDSTVITKDGSTHSGPKEISGRKNHRRITTI